MFVKSSKAKSPYRTVHPVDMPGIGPLPDEPPLKSFDEVEARRRLDRFAATYQPKFRWTEQQDSVLKEYYGKVVVTELAGVLGHSVASVWKRAQKLGLRSELGWGVRR